MYIPYVAVSIHAWVLSLVWLLPADDAYPHFAMQHTLIDGGIMRWVVYTRHHNAKRQHPQSLRKTRIHSAAFRQYLRHILF